MRALEKERKKNLKSSMERKHESITTGFDQGWQISDISNLSETAMKDAQSRWDHVAKPLHSLGLLEDALVRIAGIQGTSQIDLTKRALVIMCADNGVVEEGVTQTGQDVTAVVTRNFTAGDSCVCLMADRADVDVFPVDIGVADPLEDCHEVHPLIRKKVRSGTRNFVKEPAMTREEVQKAFQVGIELVKELKEQDYHLIALGEMGIGNTTSTAAIVSAFLGLPPELTVGRGTGINDERMAIKRKVVADGLAKNQPRLGDAMDILCKVGGYDHAGLAGMILAGARRRVPTMVDGVNATAAALLAYGLEPACAEYMLCSHLSAEISHAKMLEVLKLTPIVDAGMRLGEGTGASLAIVILQMAINTYKELTKRGGMHA